MRGRILAWLPARDPEEDGDEPDPIAQAPSPDVTPARRLEIDEAIGVLETAVSELPPGQRAQMEQLLGGGDEGASYTIDAVDTGKTDKVESRSCKVWDIKRNGELDDQYCVVTFAQLPGNENFQAVFASFAKVFEEMAKSVPMMAGMMSNEFSAQSKVNGYPVRSRGYENGKLGDSEQLMKVWREEAIPASTFEIPAGYKQKQMPMGPG